MWGKHQSWQRGENKYLKEFGKQLEYVSVSIRKVCFIHPSVFGTLQGINISHLGQRKIDMIVPKRELTYWGTCFWFYHLVPQIFYNFMQAIKALVCWTLTFWGAKWPQTLNKTLLLLPTCTLERNRKRHRGLLNVHTKIMYLQINMNNLSKQGYPRIWTF